MDMVVHNHMEAGRGLFTYFSGRTYPKIPPYQLFCKVIIFAAESTMKRFNGSDIYQTIVYVKNHRRTFIRPVIESHVWSDPGKKEANIVEPIHPD